MGKEMDEIIRSRLEKGIVCPFIKDCEVKVTRTFFQAYCGDQVGCIYCNEHQCRMESQAISNVKHPQDWVTNLLAK